MRRGLAAILVCAGCVATGQQSVQVPLFVAGTDVEGAFEGRDGVSIVLQRAELAFGPLYLCAGTQAGELCETARLEWLDAAVVDALDPEADEVGELGGVSGTVRSWMFDLGHASLFTQPEPFVLPAAEGLGGASARLEGVATVGDLDLPFSAAVVVRAEEGTEAGVPVVRKSGDDAFEHDVEPGDAGLVVTFDPRDWLGDLDFGAFVPAESCAPDGPVVACDGTVELQCDAAGQAVGQTDCRDADQICVSSLGCADRLEIDESSPPGLSIRNQLVAGPRPRFEWKEDAR